MAYTSTAIRLSADERSVLERNVRAATSEQRLAFRSRIVLMAADGIGTNAIAAQLQTNPATVSKWRVRFAQMGLEGLADAPRCGAPGKYTKETERRILAKLDEPAPRGETVWTARLLASALGDVSEDHVWRVFRKHGIHLQRRRSWCVSTDPEFAAKAADIVALYLAPPETRLSSASMRSPRSRRWSVPRATCASATGRPTAASATATSGTARRPSSAPSRWPPGW